MSLSTTRTARANGEMSISQVALGLRVTGKCQGAQFAATSATASIAPAHPIGPPIATCLKTHIRSP